MRKVSAEIETLTASLEEKKKEIQGSESALQAQVGKKKEEMKEMEVVLKEARRQERLERVDKELAAFHGDERKKEDQFNQGSKGSEACKKVEDGISGFTLESKEGIGHVY